MTLPTSLQQREVLASHVEVLGIAGLAWFGIAVGKLSASNGWLELASNFMPAVAALTVGVALFKRNILLLAFSVFAVSLLLGWRGEAGYELIGEQAVDEIVTIAGDPERSGGWRVEAVMESGLRVELNGYGQSGFVLSGAQPGQKFLIEGRAKPIQLEGFGQFQKARHVSGSVAVSKAVFVSEAPVWRRVPERLRETIVEGSEALPIEHRALYLGLVIGDDRAQSEAQQLKFRQLGLSHLLAVSGQNVAFMLALAKPLLQRLTRHWRLVAIVGLLFVFVLITRGEPSVLRASFASGIAAWAALTGRTTSGLRSLSVAVVALMWIDPFLIDRVGFQLSVAASLGVLVLYPRLSAAFEWVAAGRSKVFRRYLVDTLALTCSAQLFVSPLLLYYFGPISLASIPANVALGWAAALLMTLGLTVGVLAGLAPGVLAGLLQVPSLVLLEWMVFVVDLFIKIPAPQVSIVTVAGMGLLYLAHRTRAKAAFVFLTAFLLVSSAWSVPRTPSVPTVLSAGVTWTPPESGGASVLVVGADVSGDVLEQIVDKRLFDIDLLIVQTSSPQATRVARSLVEIAEVKLIVAAPDHSIKGAVRIVEPTRFETAAGTLLISPLTQRSLDVAVI